jgi:hypothetical protein
MKEELIMYQIKWRQGWSIANDHELYKLCVLHKEILGYAELCNN